MTSKPNRPRRRAPLATATALIAGSVIGVMTQHVVSADQSSGSRPVLIPIETCRLVDTRPNDTGVRATPLGDGETATFNAGGVDTACEGLVPSDAVAIATNITAINPTQRTFLTVWSDGPAPTTSSLNPAPGQPPTPNAVTTAVTATGDFSVYNDAGQVDILVDMSGYYVGHDHDDRYFTREEVEALVEAGPSSSQCKNIFYFVTLIKPGVHRFVLQ